MLMEFHFLLNEKTDLMLADLKKETKRKISKIIVSIIEKMIPYLEKHEISFEDKSSRYHKVGEDDEYRKHIHVYMPEQLYRRLKKIHQDINYYSMAQILRKIIELYLKNYLLLGMKKHKEFLEMERKKWEAEKVRIFAGAKFRIRQLKNQIPPKPSITITYDTFFKPYIIQML